MNRLLATSLIALATGFSPAAAADLGGSKDSTPDVTPHVMNWSGLLLGASVGYQMVNHELSAPGFKFDGISSDGFDGCGIVGAQKQFGIVVVGAEGRGCLTNASTDLTIGSFSGSLDLNESYATYGKVGLAHGDWLFSMLGGYKWQSYSVTGGFDDTVGGISGGPVIEFALDDHWIGGIEGIFTKYDSQNVGPVKIEPLQMEIGARLTYRIGY